VYWNKVLRLYGARRDGVVGSWRQFYNEDLHNLKSSISGIVRLHPIFRYEFAGI
jgi:hypothetical protein